MAYIIKACFIANCICIAGMRFYGRVYGVKIIHTRGCIKTMLLVTHIIGFIDDADKSFLKVADVLYLPTREMA